MRKRKFCMIGIFAVCFMLTGCGHEHTWSEATCTEPKTCSECGETEGEPLQADFEKFGLECNAELDTPFLL